MTEKVIGILGGMGPEATLNCFAKILKNTPAGCDQEHLHVLIENNPKVPDRTAAVLTGGDSPLPLLIRGSEALQRAGADFIIIPCVTAHYFFEPLQAASPLPIFSILDAVVENIVRHHPQMETLGVMATGGTIESGIFQKRLAAAGLETVICSAAQQGRVMAAIMDIKNAHPPRPREAITADLAAAAETLIAKGAQGIIAGCTEIPLGLGPVDVSVPYFDSLLILARRAIREAGRKPVASAA